MDGQIKQVCICVGGLPGGTGGKEPTCQCRRTKSRQFDPWVKKIPWRRKCQPTPVFLPGKSHGQRSLAGYSPWGCKESDSTEHTCPPTHIHSLLVILVSYSYLTKYHKLSALNLLSHIFFSLWVQKSKFWQDCTSSENCRGIFSHFSLASGDLLVILDISWLAVA